MSQLTEEQQTALLTAAKKNGSSEIETSSIIAIAQNILKPPPTWGELYNLCYWESGCDTEKAAKMFIREFIKHEIEPLLEGNEPYVYHEEIRSVIARFSE